MTPEGVFDHQDTVLSLLRRWEYPDAVEVGVASGRTSEFLLRGHTGLQLWMVDSWRCPSSGTRKTQKTYDNAMHTALDRTLFAASRRRVFHMTSVSAAGIMPNENFHLIFIDAHHEYESVRDDMAAWWPKLRPGGIFCGHDIDSDKDKRGVWGVRRAVEEFCRTHGLEFTVDKNTWVMDKPR